MALKKIDYEHFSRFSMLHSPAVKGDTVYFCVRKADMKENCYKSDLYSWSEAKGVRRLTSSGDVNSIELMDNGILFAALRSKEDKENAQKKVPGSVFYCLPYDGGEAEKVLSLPYAVTGIKRLKDGSFYFTADRWLPYADALEKGEEPEQAMKTAKGDGECTVLDEINFYSNGRGYVNKHRNALYLYKDGQATLLSDRYETCSLEAVDEQDNLYYITSSYETKRSLTDKLLMRTPAGEVKDLSVGEGVSHRTVFCLKDGTLVAMAGLHEQYGMNENAVVFRRENDAWVRLPMSDAHNLYNSVGSDIKCGGGSFPAGNVKNDLLYFIDTQKDSAVLAALDPKTGDVCNITSKRQNISGVDFFGDGFAMIAMDDMGGTELYTVDMQGNQTVVTHFNDSLKAEYDFSQPVDISFVDEVGTPVNGWYMKPANFEEGKKYPVILDIHGGPKTVYGSCYFHEMQLWASMGYGVIFCNPTGGDGLGNKFADIRGHYGDQDYRDIMGFVDTCLAACDWMDADRMGVTGGSYGGFMTNWIIGHTDRFKAAASQRSISNWISFYNTSDIGWYFAADQVDGDPWNDTEKLWQQSPLRYADKVTTPTLFIHSEEDYRCPLSEGLQMFSALCALGVKARLCQFKGENHELSRSGKPQNRVRRLKEITEWMEQFLK